MIPDSQLTKGEIRKLNAAKKMLGDSVGENAFAQWYATKPESVIKDDPIAQQIVQALDRFKNDKKFKLGNRGYIVKRTRGKDVKSGFIATRIEK